MNKVMVTEKQLKDTKQKQEELEKKAKEDQEAAKKAEKEKQELADAVTKLKQETVAFALNQGKKEKEAKEALAEK